MATIKEDYVSFEVAKLLKEKGFPLPSTNFEDWVFCMYDENGDIQWGCYHPDYYARVTLQMAMKWLREVHHIHTEICLYKTSENDVEPKKSRKDPYYTFGIWDSVTGNSVDKRLTNDFIGDTYEQACETAIKYCLENLI